MTYEHHDYDVLIIGAGGAGLRAAIEAKQQGLSVAIGSEHGYEPLSTAAVVVAPVTVDGEVAGAVGLLGPTRMNYPEALATAEMVSQQLGQRLGDLIGDR